MRVLVTGGAGFIGSAVIRHMIRKTDWSVLNLDKMTYAASLDSLRAVATSSRYQFRKVDICDVEPLACAFRDFRPNAVVHLAAESHVDRSIDSPEGFLQTNVVGTLRLLQIARRYREDLPEAEKRSFRFHHVSTDEVFGSLEFGEAPFDEDTRYEPNSPYSASKAAADHLVRAWHHTYGLPVLVTNCTNNYGPYHFPEKLIPLMIIKAMRGQPLPIYGKGENVRDWIFVEDHAAALIRVLTAGMVGETYLIGGKAERRNLDVVTAIADQVDEICGPLADGRRRADLITHVSDRPGHDLRYAIDCSKVERELGWRPPRTFESGLRETVEWFLANEAWWAPLMCRYQGERLGAPATTIRAARQ